MKKIYISLIFCFISINVFSEQLSDLSYISIITCKPGNEVYSSFGHTAIRVNDIVNKIDIVYNYGTFDMSQKNFLFNFVKGDILYFQSHSSFELFYYDYYIEKRIVIEQQLDLTLAQKQNIYNILINDSLPQNKYYEYNFISNNCTTKIFDIINSVNPIYSSSQEKFTFRNIMNKTLKSEGLKLIYNILMGKDADTTLSGKQRNCLPEVFMVNIDKTIQSNNSEGCIVLSKRIINVTNKEKGFNLLDTNIVFILCGILLFQVILLIFFRKHYKYFLKILISAILFISGCFGVFIITLWLFDFNLASNNINILWALPTNLILAFTKKTQFINRLLLGNAILISFYFILLVFRIQCIDVNSFLVVVYFFLMYIQYLYYWSPVFYRCTKKIK